MRARYLRHQRHLTAKVQTGIVGCTLNPPLGTKPVEQRPGGDVGLCDGALREHLLRQDQSLLVCA